MPAQDFDNLRNLVTRIDHYRLAALLISENRTVALEQAHGKNFMNHAFILYGPHSVGGSALSPNFQPHVTPAAESPCFANAARTLRLAHGRSGYRENALVRFALDTTSPAAVM